MPFKIVVQNGGVNPDQAEWHFKTDVKLCTEVPPTGRNCFREKLISQLVPGDMICPEPGRPGPSNEVVSVTET
jgi:hypothetical protein